jgi:riboflavin-specific deaminase-like protein
VRLLHLTGDHHGLADHDELEPSDLATLYGAGRERRRGRPWVTVGMIASADGATSLDGVSGPLGGPGDKAVFRTLRSLADVILVGAGTVRAEDYGPPLATPAVRAARRARGQRDVPRLAIVTGRLDLDPAARVFAPDARPVVVTTEDAAADARARFADVADVLAVGTGQVDLAAAVVTLGATGAGAVLCEGGPSLNGQLLSLGLVDELCLTIAPLAVAGSGARLAHGPPALGGPCELTLAHAAEEDGFVFLRYVARSVAGAGESI